jgi:uncharacterized membrane protein YjjP (DUF1212 family)
VSVFKQRLLSSLFIGFLVTLFIWIIRNYLAEKMPLFLFNFVGLLKMPGNFAVLLITTLIAPQNGWQIMHEVPPYDYYVYFANLIFYSSLVYLVQKYLKRHKRKVHSGA